MAAPPALEARREEDEDGRHILVDAAERIAEAVEAKRPGTAITGVVEDEIMAEPEAQVVVGSTRGYQKARRTPPLCNNLRKNI